MRYFDNNHDDGGVFPGVPKADIPDDTWNALPEWLQKSVDESSMYRKTRPDKPKVSQVEGEGSGH
jgi:hypothetical protein